MWNVHQSKVAPSKKNIQTQGQGDFDQSLNRGNKSQPREWPLYPQVHGEYRYKDPYLTKKKEISLRNRKNELQIYHLPPPQDRIQAYLAPWL